MHLQHIPSKIYEIRKQKMMPDFDLAEWHQVETRVLKQAVKRNAARFPVDFMFQLTEKEWQVISSQIVMTSNSKRPKSALAYAFTEQGPAMLSGVLHSEKAIQVNISIMSAFVVLREFAISNKELTQKLKEIEGKYDKQFKDVYEAITFLLQKDNAQQAQQKRKRIGYKL